MKKLFILSIGILAFECGFTQKAKLMDSTGFKLQFDFLSNYVYNGRADSITYPYQITTATLNFGKGFYTSFSADYLMANGQNRFDFFELDFGKEYSFGKNTSGEIYASKYFYSSNANVISGDISSDIGTSLNHDFGIFQINNTADLFFSGATDIQYTLGLSKSFDFESEAGSWNITPSLNTISSTLGYYESVVNRKLNPLKGAKNKLVNANLPTVNVVTTVQDKGFKLMATELSLPISYESKQWGLEITPTYAFPFNKAITNSIVTTTSSSGTTTSSNNSTPYSENNLRNIFYLQAGVFFKF